MIIAFKCVSIIIYREHFVIIKFPKPTWIVSVAVKCKQYHSPYANPSFIFQSFYPIQSLFHEQRSLQLFVCRVILKSTQNFMTFNSVQWLMNAVEQTQVL